MILLASLAVGVVAYLAVGLVTGYTPKVGTRLAPTRRARPPRQTWLLQAGTEPTSDRVIEVLVLAHERGGRIVTEVLRDLADATARDCKTLEEIASDRLEPKINSRAVFALPWFVLVMLTATPGPIRDFYRTSRGVAVIVLAALMSLVGIWIVERLSRDPVEERVFASSTGRGDGDGLR